MNADRVSIAEYEILYKAALAEENVPRNRYANVLANEHSRVRLSGIAVAAAQATQGTAVDRSRGFGGTASIPSDYINANRINGVAPHAGYIATQAPLGETASHFWHMIVDEQVPIIVMLNRVPEWPPSAKSDRYWPGDEAGNTEQYDSTLSVTTLVHAMEDDYMRDVIVRRFRIVRRRPATAPEARLANGHAAGSSGATAPGRAAAVGGGDVAVDTHEVIHLQFCAWPDQGVPDSAESLLDLLERIDRELRLACGVGPFKPVVVHCSAGVGRTGTLMAVDLSLRRFLSSNPMVHNGHSDDGAVVGAANGGTTAVGQLPQVPPLNVDSMAVIVRDLKLQRSRMVQTPIQYRFVFEALAAGIKRLADLPHHGGAS